MDEQGDDLSSFPLCVGAMTGVAIVAHMACQNKLIDRKMLIAALESAQNKSNPQGRIPLAMLLLLLEVLATNPATII